VLNICACESLLHLIRNNNNNKTLQKIILIFPPDDDRHVSGRELYPKQLLVCSTCILLVCCSI